MIETIRTEILFSRAQRLVQQDKLDEAIEVFDRALSISPKYSGIYLHKALALSDEKKYEDSVTTIMKAIQLDPSNPVYYMFLGRIHYDHRRFDKALQAFEKSLLMDSGNVLTLCFKNLALLAMGNIDDTYEELKEKVVNTNADFKSRLLVLCESFLLQKKDLSKTLEENIKEGNIVLRERSSRICRILEDVFDKANQLLMHILYYGLVLFYRCRYASNPKKKSAYLHYLEGDKRNLLGDSEAAIEEYIKALSLLPDFDEPKEELAEIYFENGDYERAHEYLKQTEEYKNALKGNRSKNTSLCLRLGIIYYKLGEYDRAIEKFMTVTELELTDYLPFYYLGLCSIAQSDAERARSWFKKATEKLNPSIAQKRVDELVRICKRG
jgi:tetratricopeptide (TPR) repeat protein